MRYYNSSGTFLGSDVFSAGSDFTISVQNNYHTVWISAPTDESIGRVCIVGPGRPNGTIVKITNDTINIGDLTDPNTPGCNDWDGLGEIVEDGINRDISLYAHIGGDLTGPIGAQCSGTEDYLDAIVYLIVQGQVQSPVTADRIDHIWAGSVSQTGDITMLGDGQITLVRVLSGDMLGDVTAPDGKVRAVRAIESASPQNIGAPSSPVTITSGVVSSFDSTGIRRIAATGNIYANIDTHEAVSTPDKSIRLFECGGDFHGSLVASTHAEEFIVEGSLFGTLTFGQALSETFDLLIGDSIESTGEINVEETDGVPNVIVVNQMNVGGEMLGTVRVGPSGAGQVVITQPNYIDTADSIGGGAVGVAQFRLHDESCDPPNGGVVRVDTSTGDGTVKLRHYGRLQTTGSPVTIERRLRCDTGSWTDVTSDFSVTIESSEDLSLRVNPTGGSDGFERGYRYRINPTSSLQCKDVSSTPAVSWDEAYIVDVAMQCAADITDSNGGGPDDEVNLFDLLAVLDAWGSCPTQTVCGSDITNAAGDGLDCEVNLFDLLLLLNSWGPCDNPLGFVPEDEQDCIDKFGLGLEHRAELEACLEALEILQE